MSAGGAAGHRNDFGGFGGLRDPGGDGGVSLGTPGAAGPLPVPATWAGKYLDPGVPPDSVAMLDGTPTRSDRVKLVYPLDGSLDPVNIDDMTLQWTGDPSARSYRIHFQNERGSYDVVAPCAASDGKCSYTVPADVWRKIAQSNPDRDVQISIVGASADRVFGSDTTATIRFSPAAIEGGFYYWSTSLKGIYRLTFGQHKAVPYISSKTNCYGCHAVSRDGSTIAWTVLEDHSLRVTPAETPSDAVAPPGRSGTMALTPDGKRVLVSGNGVLTLRDPKGAEIATFDRSAAGGRGLFFPEFSADGKSITVTVGPSVRDDPSDDWEVQGSDIAVIPFEADHFGSLRVVVPHDGADSHFYSTWSPDGQWLAFNSAPTSADDDDQTSYDNPNARLRLVRASGGTVYELGRATQGLGQTSSWPKFTPFSQQDGQLLFLTFNSKMAYGFKKPQGERPQLWLAAVDLRKLASGDPSWSPMWLPFQEVDQSNHLGFWTESVTCAHDGTSCGEGAVCYGGVCIVPVP